MASKYKAMYEKARASAAASVRRVRNASDANKFITAGGAALGGATPMLAGRFSVGKGSDGLGYDVAPMAAAGIGAAGLFVGGPWGTAMLAAGAAGVVSYATMRARLQSVELWDAFRASTLGAKEEEG